MCDGYLLRPFMLVWERKLCVAGLRVFFRPFLPFLNRPRSTKWRPPHVLPSGFRQRKDFPEEGELQLYVSSKGERGDSPLAPIGAHLLTIDPVRLHSGHAKGDQGRRERAAINLDCWFINHHLSHNFTIFNCCSLLCSRKPWTRKGIEPVDDLRNLSFLRCAS